MFKSNSISLAAAIALAGSLTLVGCGSSSTTETGTTGSGDTTTQNTQVAKTGSITGSVKFINNPTDRTIRTDATTQVVAYNLDDNTKYTTTSTSNGEYDLSGLSEGNYQVIATSTSTTMRSIRQASVKRDTRTVVDIVLQATGTIKGTVSNIEPYTLVIIPGTSYISTVDKSGNFELINVPAGDVTISFGGYTQNVTVTGGEATTVTDLGASTQNSDVRYVYGYRTNSTLEMMHEGLRISMRNSYTLDEFRKLVSLEDANGTAVDIQVDYMYGWYTTAQESNYFSVNTSSVLDAGTYTLKIATDDAYTKEIILKDKIAVFGDTETEAGVYSKNLGIAFSNAPKTDVNSSTVTVSYVDDANETQTLPITSIEVDTDETNEYIIHANFDSGVKYHVTLDSALAEDGLFYVSDNSWYLDGITLGDTSVSYISVDENEKNVALDKTLRFNVNNSEALDLQTLTVMLGDKELTLKNGGLHSYNSYSSYSNYLDIVVDNSSLTYSSDVTMTITANDSYGDKALDKKVSFFTVIPENVGVLPFIANNSDDDYDDDFLNQISNFYEGALRAFFNVPVDYASGKITLHDNTNNKEIPVHTESSSENQPMANVTDTPYSVGAYPSEFLPNTEYTMSVSGYTAEDGTKIAPVTNTFKTPSRGVTSHSVSNGQLRNAGDFQNRLEFTTFGKLSDAEKADLVNGLTITSFKTAMIEDKTHPKPLALWDDNIPYGSKLILAFTIEKGTSYELDFSGSVAKELKLSASPLTFMTMGDQVAISDYTPTYNIINNFYTYGNNQDSNLSIAPTTVSGQVSVTIPYIIDDNYNSTSSQKCSDLKYKNIYNYSGYETTPDVNASDIRAWMNGDELNVTSTSLSGMYYNSHYTYEDGQSHYNYSCDVTYNAKFTIANDVNSSVTVNVPASALEASDIVADGFNAVDTNRTDFVYIDTAYASVNIYGTSFSINFSKPVSVASLKSLTISTNPDLNIETNTPSSNYYDADGNRYTTNVSGTIDSSAYSVYGYDVNGTVTYYDVMAQTTKDLNVTATGVVYTQADLTPLEVTNVSTSLSTNQITLDVNRRVELDTVLSKEDNGTIISSAFTLSNEDNESNVTAMISSVSNATNYSTYPYTAKLNLNVRRSDYNNDNCYDAMTFTLTQDEAIKAEGSTQTLDAGSVTSIVTLPENHSECGHPEEE